ncbi:MAG: bifunctional diaminohydroxyphosphoribosylaminopyrimidine deaminase/5-amino-6-(5-phosphoribosylamino)uracil reductase RibD [Campylobacterota bacterium]|nr:bifunctional diaminohydroxyphosphoribosylaminopyrimidine deaminase/5-amino-6-(5-phosphoribosylamino)uracil reductase RibD [Campylobacterota bacterium]
MHFDALLMQLVIRKAWEYQGVTYPNPAVGALVALSGEIIAIEAHQKAGTSHAEVLALLTAYENISGKKIIFDKFDAEKAHAFLRELPQYFFAQCAIYVTLEPCSHRGQTPSCASLLEVLSLQKVIVALRDPIEGHGGGIEMLMASGVEVEVGVMEDEARELIEPFLIWQKRAFVLFKLAQTTNGRIGGGYLSSKESLEHVHEMREVCDRLLIGGGTVRYDRPTLDCRFSAGDAPDIVIYSRQDNFDRDIPLFGIEGRKVQVSNNLNLLDRPSFVIVEGGEGMLRVLDERIDWYLTYQTPKLSTHNLSYSIDKTLHFLHTHRKGVDIMIWSKATPRR